MKIQGIPQNALRTPPGLSLRHQNRNSATNREIAMKASCGLLCILCTCLVSCSVATEASDVPTPVDIETYRADVAVAWNERILDLAIAEDGLLTLKGVRTLSMLHVSMHDALNTIQAAYAPYGYDVETADADPIAAAAQAAYQVAVDQYPEARDLLTEELNRWLDTVDDGPTKRAGVALGKASAAAILVQRANDSWNAEGEYNWRPMGPGVYAGFSEHSGTPEGFVFGAGWAGVEPFMLTEQHQFRSPPPPQINSDAYAQAYDEVKDVGRFESTSRSADQTHLAMWWKDFAENSHNRLARTLAQDRDLNLWEASRMFALLNMTLCDAYISVFDNKFHYNHWRPYTAIRAAAEDGNPNTTADATWDNLHGHTYAFPSYPSAHGTASAAAMTILEGVFGDSFAFTMTTAEVDRAGPLSGKVAMDPPTRAFESFREAAMECAMSRVYLGIHFRYDSEEGYRLGRQIGDYAWDNFLRLRLE
jgi:hypothetical protein